MSDPDYPWHPPDDPEGEWSQEQAVDEQEARDREALREDNES